MTSRLGIRLAINGQAPQSELLGACKGHAICAQQNQQIEYRFSVSFFETSVLSLASQ